nr:MAG TPA: hypothetical protein [Caudoviricetes sp.]
MCLVDGTEPFSFIQLIGKWVTDLACVHGLQRSRFLLRPLPSGRASLAVSLLYTIAQVHSIYGMHKDLPLHKYKLYTCASVLNAL